MGPAIPITAAGLLVWLALRARSPSAASGGLVIGGPSTPWRARHFSQSELVVTSTGLTNVPTTAEWDALNALAADVLDPIRRVVGPMRITSGFRSLTVNSAVGGSSTSRHRRGQAADFRLVSGGPSAAIMPAIAAMVRSGLLPVRQLILYHPTRGGHIHVDHSPTSTTAQLLYVAADGSYQTWSGQA